MGRDLQECSPLVGLGAALLVCLSVFLGADLLSVLVGYQSRMPAEPLVAASPSSAGLKTSGAWDLAVLRPPASSPTASPATKVPDEGEVTDAEPGGEVLEGPQVDLQGVMLGGGVGIAVLEVEGQDYTASVGDEAGGYKVVEIHPDRVVLSQGGRTFPVRLSGAPAAQVVGEGPPVLPDPGEVPPPPVPAPASGGPPRLPPPPLTGVQAPAVSAAPAASVSHQDIDAFLEQGAALARDVRGVAVPGDGRGVRLEFRNAANALARLGLKNGDVVLSLNGEPIRTPEELYNSYLILRKTPSVEFEVLRGGQPTSVRYDFPEGDPG